MGLRGTIQRAAQAATKAIGDIPGRAYLQHASATAYDAASGVATPALTTTFLPRVLLGEFDSKLVDGDAIRATDRVLSFATLDAAGVTFGPQDIAYVAETKDVVMTASGNVITGGVKYTVIDNLQRDPAGAWTRIHLRP